MADISYIGAAIACVAATPATVDSAGFAALTWTATIGEIVEWGEVGDTSNDITIDKLSGRIVHVNGAKDGGEIAFSFAYTAADAGQVILRAQSNTNTEVSIRITDPDAKVIYLYGKIANVRDMARNSNTYKGMTGVIRVNSAVVVV